MLTSANAASIRPNVMSSCSQKVPLLQCDLMCGEGDLERVRLDGPETVNAVRQTADCVHRPCRPEGATPAALFLRECNLNLIILK